MPLPEGTVTVLSAEELGDEAVLKGDPITMELDWNCDLFENAVTAAVED